MLSSQRSRYPTYRHCSFPVAAIAALATEAVVFRTLNRDLSWGRILGAVLVINIVSAVVGFAIAAALPSGLEPTLAGEGENRFETIRPGPEFGMYAILGYVLAFALSILIEWGLVRTSRRFVKVAKPFITVALANGASYAVLIGVSMVWSRFFW